MMGPAFAKVAAMLAARRNPKNTVGGAIVQETPALPRPGLPSALPVPPGRVIPPAPVLPSPRPMPVRPPVDVLPPKLKTLPALPPRFPKIFGR